MPHSSSDAIVDVLHVCRYGLRFNLGARWKTFDRSNPWGVKPGGQAGPADPAPALYKRIHVASPPPSRAGGPWEDGLRVVNGTPDGRPLRPTGDDGTSHPVFCLEGAPSLDQPAPGTTVFDGWVPVPPVEVGPEGYVFVPGETGFVFRTDEADLKAFLSVPYPQPHLGGAGMAEVPVAYFGRFSITWDQPLPVGSWIAISLDRFCPPERGSADYIARIEDCTLPLPSGTDGATASLHGEDVPDLTALRTL